MPVFLHRASLTLFPEGARIGRTDTLGPWDTEGSLPPWDSGGPITARRTAWLRRTRLDGGRTRATKRVDPFCDREEIEFCTAFEPERRRIMPGFDGTGPRGMGPMTGGGRGFCSPWGLGATSGRGRGMPYPLTYGGAPYGGVVPPPGIAPYAPRMSEEQELQWLKEEARRVKEQLTQISDRIRELET